MEGERAASDDAYFLAKKFLAYKSTAEPEPATSQALASFSAIDIELRRLLSAPPADDFGPVRPTSASVTCAKATLFPLVQRGFGFPEAVDVGTDHDGGLRLVWENGPRFLELVVPRENHAAPYLYYSEDQQYNLQRDLAFGALRDRFNWLIAGNR
jgi:hypothetical protein